MPELARPLKCGSIMAKGSSTLDYLKDFVAIHPTIQIVGFLAPFPIILTLFSTVRKE